jgi:hypothetical protein
LGWLGFAKKGLASDLTICCGGRLRRTIAKGDLGGVAAQIGSVMGSAEGAAEREFGANRVHGAPK